MAITAGNALGLILLAHAAYSSQEFTRYAKFQHTSIPFPQDIYLEIGISVCLFLYYILIQYPQTMHKAKLSLVDSNRTVKPSTTLHEICIHNALVDDEIRKASDFYKVETRINYVDWFAKRQQFEDWKKAIVAKD